MSLGSGLWAGLRMGRPSLLALAMRVCTSTTPTYAAYAQCPVLLAARLVPMCLRLGRQWLSQSMEVP